MTSPVPGHDVPTGEQPGAGSTPGDEGDGIVGLADRTGGGAPAANQTKVEPLPPTPEHTSPDVAPGPVSGLNPDEMRIGAADPQAPSHPAGGRRPDHGSSYVEVAVEDGSAAATPRCVQYRLSADTVQSHGVYVGVHWPITAGCLHWVAHT